MVGLHPSPSSTTTTIRPLTSDVDPMAIVGTASRGMHPSMSSMRHSANNSIPAVAADQAMASFVAEPPRSTTGHGPSYDETQIPAAESSSAAVLRQKLTQLSLQQQRHHRSDVHTRPPQLQQQQSPLNINVDGNQRDTNSSSRSPPQSSSRLAASIRSHNDTCAARESRSSLYKLSRGRSDHVSPSRRWDRRGASATVLSGNSGSGSGGEDSEITVRPDRASRQQQPSAKRSSPSPRHQPHPNGHHAQGSALSSTDGTVSIGTTVATTPSPSLSRKSSFRRHNSGLARWTDNKSPTVAFDADSHHDEAGSGEFPNAHGAFYDLDQGHVTSSDEEGADASRFACRRRASLGRDRRRGMRMLASGGASTFTAIDTEERLRDRSATSHSRRKRRTSSERKRGLGDLDADLRLTPASEVGSAFPSTSTSTSATPTTGGDDYSERSSLLSRSSSSDTVDRVGPLTGLTPSVARRSRMPSAGENAEASIFGLADDEQDHRGHGTSQHRNGDRLLANAINEGAEDADISSEGHNSTPDLAALSPSALADALAKRRSRSKPSTLRGSPVKGEKIRSLPASRRPSHPETSIPGASASSVPHRPSAILGFAPVASPSPAGMASRFNTLPRRRGAQVPSKTAWLSLSPSDANQGDQSAMIDLLSGSSVGSVEDLILVDQVEWASDKEDATSSRDQAFQRRKAKAVDSRRSSMISVRQGEMDLLEGSGQPTVAALEAGSMLSGRGTSRDRSSNTSSSPSGESALPPVSPTGSGEAIFSRTDPVTGRQGFDAVYQDRISNLQSQLRLWSRNPQHRTSSPERKGTESGSPPGATATEGDHPNVQPATASHSSGLLASSWKQIARLPNLFFHAGGSHDNNELDGVSAPGVPALSRSATGTSIGTNGTVTPLTRSSSASAEADVSSFADDQAGASSALSSPDASRLNLRSTSDSEASGILLPSDRTASSDTAASRRRPSHGRSPSLGARGVISPQDGDVDPGAYVSGLGHRIDPDVELASVVHMHASRAHRGKSVDAGRRSSSHHGAGHPLAAHQLLTPLSSAKDRAERVVASDSERSPVLNAQGGVEELLSKPQAIGTLPVLHLPPSSTDAKTPAADAPSATAKVQPDLSSDVETTSSEQGLAPLAASTPRKARSRARFNLHNDDEEQNDKVDVGKDAEPADKPIEAASARAPAVEPKKRRVADVDDDGFTIVRGHRGRGRPGVSRPAAEAPVPVNFSAYGDMSSSASDEDTGVSPRAVRSRSRGRFSKEDVHYESTAMTPSSSEASSAGRTQSGNEDEEEQSRGSARGRRGRGRGQGGRDQSPPASSRTRQCAIGLFSASNKTPRRDGSPSANADSKIAAATRSDLGMRTVRSSPNLSYAKVAASRVGQGNSKRSPDADRGGRGRGCEGAQDGDSSDDDRSRRGRARGVTKVTSSSFKDSECPPNSLPRSASAGDFRSLSFAPSSPEAAASQSHALRLRKQRVLASQSTGNASSSATSDLANAVSPSSSESGSSSGALSLEQSDDSSSASGSLMSVPNRPTLLSNSAHLLMLSLELEMMRAQKISAPLRIRWARQRTVISSAVLLGDATASAIPNAPSAETDPDVDATSGSDASALVAAPSLPASSSESANRPSQRDPAKGNPLYSSLFNAQQLYGRVYRPRQASQLRNVLNAHST